MDCSTPGFQDWAQSTCPELSAQNPLGTGWDFSQDYIGIGYCGMEGDYSFIYDPEILNHSPGSVFFLYGEDWTPRGEGKDSALLSSRDG